MSAILNRTLLLAPAAMLLVAIYWSSQLQAKQEQPANSNDQQSPSKVDGTSKSAENLIVNGGFANKEGWSFEIQKNSGGVASIDFNDVARIERKNGGKARWSINLVQKQLALKANTSYRVSFRTKAEHPTKCSFQIGKIGISKVRYTKAVFFDAATEWTEKTHDFTMGPEGDLAARFGFNIGGDTGTMFLDDVRIEEVVFAPEEVATSADGNLLDNGEFKNGDAWKLNNQEGGKATVKYDGMATVVREAGGSKTWSIKFSNDSLNLKPDSHYQMSFRAWAEGPTKFAVVVGNSITTTPYSHRHQVKVSNSWIQVRQEFSTGKAYANAQLVFNMGQATGKVIFDDVKIEEVKSSRVAARTDPETKIDKDDIVSGLQERVNTLVNTKRKTKEQRLELDQLKTKLEVAQYLEKQVVLTKMTEFSTGNLTNEKFAGEEDHFVIAKIKVGRRAKVADFEFASSDSYHECTRELFEFVKGTPAGGYRDYRILGRFSDAKLTKAALAEVRSSYDAHKEEQARMLAYIQQRARESQQSKDRARSLMSKMGGGGSGGSGNGGGVTSCRRT